ncbi:MAG: alpha-amylase/4-alpha-glucanotransferase domain-containing protein [Acidobacteriota bacterium]
MKKLFLSLLIHNHQPVENFSSVVHDAYRKAYLPFLKVLEKHPGIKLSLHYSGWLFDFLLKNFKELELLLKKLLKRKQIELISGGFYEPILSSITSEDAENQIRKLNNFIEERFGIIPEGFWVAERVWEPSDVEVIVRSGLKFTVLDETHFLLSGLKREDLNGYFITEHNGYSMNVFPSSEKLRYLIPFHPVEEVIDYLRYVFKERNFQFTSMGDDGEKFGVWPNTYRLCYEKKWLENFFEKIEKSSDWIETIKFSDIIKNFPAKDRIYFPTASYFEMMEWALSSDAQKKLIETKEILKNSGREDLLPFVRGGFWRLFLVKYYESNYMHKRMLGLSHKFKEIKKTRKKLFIFTKAYDSLLKSQSNDFYWHGIFGGLYLPHLRTVFFRNLLEAEYLIEKIENKSKDKWSYVEENDIDCDLKKEIMVRTQGFSIVFKPDEGGSVVEISYKLKKFNLINSLKRREEIYHSKIVRNPLSKNQEKIETIHGKDIKNEEGLKKFIIFDKNLRNCFISHIFPPDFSFSDFRKNNYEPVGPYGWETHRKKDFILIKMLSKENNRIEKEFRISKSEPLIEFVQKFKTQHGQNTRSGEGIFGVEFNFNFLAPDSTDRNLIIDNNKFRLDLTGERNDVEKIEFEDLWLGIRLKIFLEKPLNLWVYPVETVSLSERGIEKIFQGTCLFLYSLEPIIGIKLAIKKI